MSGSIPKTTICWDKAIVRYIAIFFTKDPVKTGPISCLVTTKNNNTYIIIIVTSSQSSQDRSLFRQPSQPLRVENSGIQNSFEFRTPPFTTLHYCTFLFLPRYRLECHPRLRGRNPLRRGWRGLNWDVLISRTLKNQILKAW